MSVRLGKRHDGGFSPATKLMMALKIAACLSVITTLYLIETLPYVPFSRLQRAATRDGDGHNRQRLPETSRFVKVRLDRDMQGMAASGLAAVVDDKTSTTYLAVANFWGDSLLFALNTTRQGLAPRLVQRFATKAAHDWEAIQIENQGSMLIAAEYDSERSLVYMFRDRDGVDGGVDGGSEDAGGGGVSRTRSSMGALEGWPACTDVAGRRSCTDWAKAGECERNPSFMLSRCSESCGRCEGLEGPLVAVQGLRGRGGTAARSFRVAGRILLFLANYLAPPGQAVSVFEWGGPRERWRWLAYIDAPGAGEVAYCPTSTSDEHLLVFPSWFANGSFATSTLIYAVGHLHSKPPTFTRRQALPSLGSHDAECFQRSGELYLLLASGRADSGRRDVPSALYRYESRAGAFVHVQPVATTGAHDFEVIAVPAAAAAATEELLVVAANGASWSAARGGDGELCNTTVDVWRFDDDSSRLVLQQSLDAGGCTTFARAWRAGTRLLLGVATERQTVVAESDGAIRSTYNASVAIFEWQEGQEK